MSQWTFHMSIEHFKYSLDPMDHWTLPITNISMIPFPGGYKVQFSPLDPSQFTVKYPLDPSQFTVKYPMTFDMSIGSIGHACTCPMGI